MCTPTIKNVHLHIHKINISTCEIKTYNNYHDLNAVVNSRKFEMTVTLLAHTHVNSTCAKETIDKQA